MPKVHPLADVKSTRIGKDTRVWEFAVIFDGAVIGEVYNFYAHTLIENGISAGNNVPIRAGLFLSERTIVVDDVFIGPSATFTNVAMPSSKVYPEIFSGITIKQGASIGANATILSGVTIGEGAMMGARAVVVSDIPDGAVVVGNPAKAIRYLTK